MTIDDDAQRDSDDVPERGLFSQLPRSRPGVRSPRRAGEGSERGKQKAASSKASGAPAPAALRAAQAAAGAREAAGAGPLDPPATGQERPRHATPPPRRPAPEPEPEQRSLGPGSLEDLAWAGVAVTAEAATLGVRLLGRAVDAAKRATERS
jgi:hypothetical protein